MILYSKYITQIVFFDLEFYVPEIDRSDEVGLQANPYKVGHFLIGGSFYRYYPLLEDTKKNKFTDFWIWNYKTEKEMLNDILKLFENCWKKIRKDPKQAELYVCGIGISRVDISYLFARCHFYGLRKDEELFSIFNNLRILELEAIVIPYFKNKGKMLKTKTTKEILAKFKIDRERESGKKIWTQYDEKNFEKITERNNNEVKDLVVIYNEIVNRIHIDNITPKFRTEHLEKRIDLCTETADKEFLKKCYSAYNKEEERWCLSKNLTDEDKLKLVDLLERIK